MSDRLLSRLYDEDFYSWTQTQAAALRAAAATRPNDPAGLDWQNLAEEIDDLGKNKVDELYSRYVIVLLHLLKWEFQPGFRCSSWRGSIVTQRLSIARLLRRNPGMRPRRAEEFVDAYPVAHGRAAGETGLPGTMFPKTCPYTLQQAEDVNFLPGPVDIDQTV